MKLWTSPTRVGRSTTAREGVVHGFGTREGLQPGTPFLLESLEDETVADVDVQLSSYGSAGWVSSLVVEDGGASFVNQACRFVNWYPEARSTGSTGAEKRDQLKRGHYLSQLRSSQD